MRSATAFLLREVLVVAAIGAVVIAIPRHPPVQAVAAVASRPMVTIAVLRPCDSLPTPSFAVAPATRSPYGRL